MSTRARARATHDLTGLGGREVFEILAREHAGMLASYLRSLVRSSEAVDDLFQETMLTAWRRLDRYDRERPFGPWLRGIAARLVLRHRERRARDVLRCDTAMLEALEERFELLGRDPERFRETIDHVLTCLRGLPGRLREAIDLAYRSGLQLEQVARRLGASTEAIKKRVQRGRRLLAECLRAQGVKA